MKSVELPQFVVRARLPSSSGYHSGPSGDTEYACDYAKAIKRIVPVGFAVIEPRPGHRRPVDSEGFTWLLLVCEDQELAMDAMRRELTDARELARSIQSKVARIAKQKTPPPPLGATVMTDAERLAKACELLKRWKSGEGESELVYSNPECDACIDGDRRCCSCNKVDDISDHHAPDCIHTQTAAFLEECDGE